MTQVNFSDGRMTTSDDGDGGKLVMSLPNIIANPAVVAGDSTPIVNAEAAAAMAANITVQGAGDKTPS